MASLVIKSALMYVLNRLFYLILSPCLLLFVSLAGFTSFFNNVSLGNVLLALGSHLCVSLELLNIIAMLSLLLSQVFVYTSYKNIFLQAKNYAAVIAYRQKILTKV